MIKHFPNNTVWTISVNLAIEMGAPAEEVGAMCTRLRAQAGAVEPDNTQALSDAWSAMGERLCSLGQEDEVHGRLLSAGAKYSRAAIYYAACERLQAPGAPGRPALYRRFLDLFSLGAALSGENCRRVDIPYEGHQLAALFVRAEGVQGRAPVLVQLNGIDSTKETKYRVGLPGWLAKRGVSSLIVDQPGTGEALRLHGITARPDSEHWARRVVDWLETRDDIDPRRIGVEGASLGSYHCPRVAAFERRFACGVVWGSHHDWRQLNGPPVGTNLPLPHYWEHVCWAWGAQDIDALLDMRGKVSLDSVLPCIRVPFLVTRRECSAELEPAVSRITSDKLRNSPKPQMKVFAEDDGNGGSGVGHSLNAGHYIADWVAETLGGRTAHGRPGHRHRLSQHA